MQSFLRENERLDDLQLDGLYILQNPSVYCFTSDAVELANFVSNARNKRVADLCAGSGVIGILINHKQKPSKVVEVEIQPHMADMCRRSVEMNGLSDKIEVICGDVKNIHLTLGYESFDVVVCNPPYCRAKTGGVQLAPEIAMSRHEGSLTLSELTESVSKILKSRGSFYLVHRFDRLAEIFYEMRNVGIEPKEMRLLGKGQPTAVLIRGVKHAGIGLKMV